MPARRKRAASESSDDEAPEAVSFGSSKKTAQGDRHAVLRVQAAEKRKKKEKNRAVDQALQERARAKGKEKAKVSGGASSEAGQSREELEDRMARAMMEAEEEDSAYGEASGLGSDLEEAAHTEGEGREEEGEEGEDEEASEDEGDDDEETGSDEDSDDGEGDDDEMMVDAEQLEDGEDEDDESEDEEPAATTAASRERNYLPDHLFKAALSTGPSKPTKIVFDEGKRASPPPQRKRKRTKRPAKDLVVGARTIRTLPKSGVLNSPSVAKGLAPPRRVEKFLKNSLNLRGDQTKSKSKGWTRRPANLGVMRRNGPAAGFVRDA